MRNKMSLLVVVGALICGVASQSAEASNGLRCRPTAETQTPHFSEGFVLKFRREQIYLDLLLAEGKTEFYAHFAPGRLAAPRTLHPEKTVAGFWHHGHDESDPFPGEVFLKNDGFEVQLSFYDRAQVALEVYDCQPLD
jgi:hypothetical protein